MISVLHLIWIIPVSALFGFLMAGLLSVSRDDRQE